jgi:hypothetical protein
MLVANFDRPTGMRTFRMASPSWLSISALLVKPWSSVVNSTFGLYSCSSGRASSFRARAHWSKMATARGCGYICRCFSKRWTEWPCCWRRSASSRRSLTDRIGTSSPLLRLHVFQFPRIGSLGPFIPQIDLSGGGGAPNRQVPSNIFSHAPCAGAILPPAIQKVVDSTLSSEKIIHGSSPASLPLASPYSYLFAGGGEWGSYPLPAPGC